MWILQFLPSGLILFFCNVLLAVGILLTIAGWFAHRIPVIYQYQLPFKILGVVLLALGVYFRGGYAIEKEWRQRVADLEDKLVIAKAESQKVNTVIKDRIVYRDKIITQQGQTLIEYIDREVIKNVPVQCERIPTELIDVHNKAAKINVVIDEMLKKEAK